MAERTNSELQQATAGNTECGKQVRMLLAVNFVVLYWGHRPASRTMPHSNQPRADPKMCKVAAEN